MFGLPCSHKFHSVVLLAAFPFFKAFLLLTRAELVLLGRGFKSPGVLKITLKNLESFSKTCVIRVIIIRTHPLSLGTENNARNLMKIWNYVNKYYVFYEVFQKFSTIPEWFWNPFPRICNLPFGCFQISLSVNTSPGDLYKSLVQ